MNENEIENLLRKAPRPAPPAGLKDKIQADITLTRATELRQPANGPSAPFWRRWLPALAFGMIFLTCFVILAVQTNQLLQIRRENEALRAATANLEQLRQENQELQKLSAQAQQLERLRKDNLEVQQLRAETDRLRQQTQALAAARAENQRLLAERAAKQAQAGAPAAEEDPFAEAKRKAQTISCVSNLKQIMLAARIWANEQEKAGRPEVLPADFLTMTNELGTPKILVCPADTARTENRPTTWTEFSPQSTSYEIISPGVDCKDPNIVYVRCPIHGSVGMVDGSVQQVRPPMRVIDVDGKKKLSSQ